MAALVLRDASPDSPDPAEEDAGEVYPGAIGPRGVALSGEECARRYPITSMTISEWVHAGILPVSGAWASRKGQPQPLIWSGDLERILAERRIYGQTGKERRQWPRAVRRAYAARGLGEPPVLATGEGLEELREPLRVWGVCALPGEEQLAALALSAEDVRALYAGLAAGLYARSITPAHLREVALELAADPRRLGPLAAMMAPERLEQLRADLASAPDSAVLSYLLAALLEQIRDLFTWLPAMSALLGNVTGALSGVGALVYAPADPLDVAPDAPALAGPSSASSAEEGATDRNT